MHKVEISFGINLFPALHAADARVGAARVGLGILPLENGTGNEMHDKI
ncbi:MAG: hypothetical protein GF398_16600 [Chitinivibrionales bacterium]|nr:hypothetical protein [Chitinivibrionales bacterium]